MNSDTKKLAILGIAAMIAVAGAVLLFSLGGGQNDTDAGKKNNAGGNTLLVRENSHSTAQGTIVYKITMVEFGDYQCPACGFAHPQVKKLLNDYSDKVKLVYRHFPLPQHKNALVAAEAAEAGAGQGKFWEMHDKLYENQQQWSESDSALEIFTTYAKDIGLDVAQFKQSIESAKFKEEIERDRKDGNDLGVNGTPTFYINGEKYNGPLNYEAFKAKINSLLSK